MRVQRLVMGSLEPLAGLYCYLVQARVLSVLLNQQLLDFQYCFFFSFPPLGPTVEHLLSVL